MIKRKEMKLIDLGKLVSEMEVGDVIDFANCNSMDVELYGGWCGVKRIDEFDNYSPMYIVSYWGGNANARLYHINEYDPRIGNFCDPRIAYRLDGANRKEKDWAECCAKMIADYLIDYDGHVNEVIIVEREIND